MPDFESSLLLLPHILLPSLLPGSDLSHLYVELSAFHLKKFFLMSPEPCSATVQLRPPHPILPVHCHWELPSWLCGG